MVFQIHNYIYRSYKNDANFNANQGPKFDLTKLSALFLSQRCSLNYIPLKQKWTVMEEE